MAADRERLFEFLDEKVFQPTLKADPLSYKDSADQRLLRNVQRRVQETRTRYVADYATAREVKANFGQDLVSVAGQALASDMWMLKLTRFEDVRQEFQTLCRQLGL